MQAPTYDVQFLRSKALRSSSSSSSSRTRQIKECKIIIIIIIIIITVNLYSVFLVKRTPNALRVLA